MTLLFTLWIISITPLFILHTSKP